MDPPPPGLFLRTRRRRGAVAQGDGGSRRAAVSRDRVQPVTFAPRVSQAGADANVQDHVGDTPLHKAAFTGRQVHVNDLPAPFLPHY